MLSRSRTTSVAETEAANPVIQPQCGSQLEEDILTVTVQTTTDSQTLQNTDDVNNEKALQPKHKHNNKKHNNKRKKNKEKSKADTVTINDATVVNDM